MRTKKIDKKKFGIVGNGIVDDSAAIQKALDAGVTLGQLPPGKYVAEGLRLPDHKPDRQSR